MLSIFASFATVSFYRESFRGSAWSREGYSGVVEANTQPFESYLRGVDAHQEGGGHFPAVEAYSRWGSLP